LKFSNWFWSSKIPTISHSRKKKKGKIVHFSTISHSRKKKGEEKEEEEEEEKIKPIN